MPREFFEIFQMSVDRIRNDFEIDIQIAVDQDVPESGYRAETCAELRGQHFCFHETVDCRGIVGGVEPEGRGQVSGDVEGILRTELESAFDAPPPLWIGIQRLRGNTGMPVQDRESRAERRKMTAHDRGIGLARTHGRLCFAAQRRAASIFASCGTKSQ